MQNITIGRYSNLTEDKPPVYAGWIEGVREDGSTWILYLDGDGSPAEYWNTREDDGGVVGEPVLL